MSFDYSCIHEAHPESHVSCQEMGRLFVPEPSCGDAVLADRDRRPVQYSFVVVAVSRLRDAAGTVLAVKCSQSKG